MAELPCRRPARRAHDPLDGAVAFACWACVVAGAGLAFLGAGLAQGGDAIGNTLAFAGTLVCCGGAGGAVVMHGGRRG